MSHQQQQQVSSRSVLNSVAAGYAAGVSGTIIGHPLDSLKVWRQTAGHQGRVPKSGTSNSTSAAAGAGGASKSSSSSSRFMSTTTTTTVSPPTSSSSSQQARMAGQMASQHSGASHRLSSTLTSSSATAFETAVRASPTTAAATTAMSRSPWSWRHINFRSLYAGVSGPLVTVGAVQALNFAIYDSVRRLLHYADHDGGSNRASTSNYMVEDSLWNVALASSTAGACLAVLTNPLLLVKTKQQTQAAVSTTTKSSKSNPLTYRQAVLQTVQWDNNNNGNKRRRFPALRNLYAGFVPHAVTEMLGRAVYFVAYESLKRHLAVRHPEQRLTLPDRMLAAGTAGVLAWTAIFPLDAVRCRMFAASSSSSAASTTASSSSSSFAMAVHMWQHGGGWRAFYRGFGVTLLRAGPVASCVLPIYDLTHDRLSSME